MGLDLFLAVLGGAALIALALYFGLRARRVPEAPEAGAALRADLLAALSSQRQELTLALGQTQQGISSALNQQLGALTESNAQRLLELRTAVDSRLREIQSQNAAELEKMRHTVDEKLQTTLEQRLGQSFRLVGERLDQVLKGFGEMQALAAGVGDLKRVLSNVKTRGTWGEMQLGNLLEQVLTLDQYEANVATRPGSRERVEFALKLPGRDDGVPVWLPIDAKFPHEDYDRLLAAQDAADAAGVEVAARELERRIRVEAQSIRDKYIAPPHTTDFAILFLPTEGLYAEVIRRPGLCEALQRDCRVSIMGPTTLAAHLNALQMGFRTLAIEKRSSEVWRVLGAVKTEFAKFGEVLKRVKSQLSAAANTLDDAETRTRQMTRKLKDVEALPQDEAAALLPPSAEADDPERDERM